MRERKEPCQHSSSDSADPDAALDKGAIGLSSAHGPDVHGHPRAGRKANEGPKNEGREEQSTETRRAAEHQGPTTTVVEN